MSTGSCASSTPELLPGGEVEVTAHWDLRDGPGEYTIIVSADAFRRLTSSARTTTTPSYPITVRANRVELTYWSDLEQLAKRCRSRSDQLITAALSGDVDHLPVGGHRQELLRLALDLEFGHALV